MSASPSPGTHVVLTLSCPDTTGIVHAVSGYILDHGATIVESQQFNDVDTGTFFMRVRFAAADGATLDHARLEAAFAPIAQARQMTWRLLDAARPKRVLIMVSQHAHCLVDLLFRNLFGELNLEVVAVVSNHPDLAHIADSYRVPFRHIPVSPDTKARAEASLMELVEAERVELVILARYMQILSDDVCERLAGRAINIHHSMLPSFKGARPYHQSHGRSVEARALARAVRLHTENRVALNGTRTVVLR